MQTAPFPHETVTVKQTPRHGICYTCGTPREIRSYKECGREPEFVPYCKKCRIFFPPLTAYERERVEANKKRTRKGMK